jgi:hypothetical protein
MLFKLSNNVSNQQQRVVHWVVRGKSCVLLISCKLVTVRPDNLILAPPVDLVHASSQPPNSHVLGFRAFCPRGHALR